MDKSLYSRRSNLVIGFHGCDKSVVDAVVAGKTDLLSSTNGYDWLGNGIYFWENNEERAWQWAKDLAKRKNSQIKEPAVVGAIIDLGYCFDLTDSTYLQELKADDLAFVDWNGKWRLEEGDFKLMIADQSADIHCTDTYQWPTANR